MNWAGIVRETLTALGFDVAGWSRTAKEIPGITCFDGRGGLDAILGRSHILICLLPLTPETEGILNAELFSKLPKGAHLINAARGGHLVEDDLIPALDSGRLAHATLDVFRTEPLPGDHPFWDHPRITVTPAQCLDHRPAQRCPADRSGDSLFSARGRRAQHCRRGAGLLITPVRYSPISGNRHHRRSCHTSV